jgi:hypothetical protein
MLHSWNICGETVYLFLSVYLEYKEIPIFSFTFNSLQAFQLMDQDKDGIISKNDLRATFDQLGRLASDKELDEMVNEAPGPINFTQLLTLFAGRMSGGA